MHSKFLVHCCGLLLLANLSACRTYSVSLNDKLVYTPLPLFKDYQIADENLRNCVEQTISDKQIVKAEQLKQLNCSNAGIASLAGLETFTALEQLNLEENALTRVQQLSHLPRLKVLSLRHNNLIQAESLLQLLHLTTLDLSENKNLPCGDLQQLVANFRKGELTVTLPEQCKNKS
ncbi:MAG TPA: leucine-rich repeat domain-containing protein [Cellvibrio sp.]|nr:leucine-rich repeat domain-containing protein [Cellvibrio sp.]